MGFSALGSNRRGGPGLWHSGICEAIWRRRDSHTKAPISLHPRAAHGQPTRPAQAEAVRPTLRGRKQSDDMTGGWRAGIRGNQTAVGNLDGRAI